MTENEMEKLQQDRRTWSIGKEIPIAVIVSFLVGMLLQTAVGAWLIRGWVGGLESQVTIQGFKITAANEKLDALSVIVQGSAVPSAINTRRIDELERIAAQQAALIVQITGRVVDNERRITLVEVRNRATRER